ncbi:hypothetical protein ACSSVV_001546 [Marinobacter sp. MBR-105]
MPGKIANALTGLLVATILVTPPAKADDIAVAWERACNASSRVQKIIGPLPSGAIDKALEAYQKAGLGDRLRQLTPFEVCTSLAATSEAEVPVFVIDRSPESLPREPVGMPVPGLPELPVQKAIEKKLRNLNLGYQRLASEDPSAGLDIRTQLQNQSVEQTSFALQVNTRKRSFSAHYDDYCLISHDDEPLATYSRYTIDPALLDGLKPGEWEWLEQYGDAMEFWHEVAHCEYPLRPLPAKPESEDGLVGMEDALKETGTQTCNASSAPGNVYGLTESDLDPFILDGVILYRVGLEAYADYYGMGQLVKRFGVGSPGCRGDGTVELTPWLKYRLVLSVYNPDLNYMTWLEPFLRGYPLPTQAASLADAWDAINRIAFGKYAGISRPRITQQVIYGDSDLYSPSQAPDTIRSAQWQAWIEDNIGARHDGQWTNKD